MTDPNSWAEYGLPALGITLGILGVYIASASARHFDAQFNEAIVMQSPAPLPASSATTHLTLIQRLTKRGFDLLIAGTALLLLLPLLLLVAAVVWLGDGKSPIFRHTRLGRDGRSFGCLKFRSMVVDADDVLAKHFAADAAAKAEWSVTHKLNNDPRVTPVGKLLRRTSLDELPQLVNVLRGEMSLVGPRPITASEKHIYGNSFADCFSVPPGILDPYEVIPHNKNDKNTLVSTGIDYATNWSLIKDIRVLAWSIPYVFRSDKQTRHNAFNSERAPVVEYQKF